MGLYEALLEGPQPRSPAPMVDLRLAASTMTGSQRRALEAEMTVQYCGGTPLLAETLCGWGRQTVAVGLAERRTGIKGLGAQAAFRGRQRWAERAPEAAEALPKLAAAQAQPDPTCRTTLASTRLTARAALDALRAHGDGEEPWPSPRTMAEGLHRLGVRRRQVVKAKPPTKMAETDALFPHMAKKIRRQQPRHPSNACVSMVQPRWPWGRAPAGVAPAAIIGRVLTLGAGTSKLFPVAASRKPVRRCGSPVGALPSPGRASSRRSPPGGRGWRRPRRGP